MLYTTFNCVETEENKERKQVFVYLVNNVTKTNINEKQAFISSSNNNYVFM